MQWLQRWCQSRWFPRSRLWERLWPPMGGFIGKACRTSVSCSGWRRWSALLWWVLVLVFCPMGSSSPSVDSHENPSCRNGWLKQSQKTGKNTYSPKKFLLQLIDSTSITTAMLSGQALSPEQTVRCELSLSHQPFPASRSFPLPDRWWTWRVCDIIYSCLRESDGSIS